MDSPYIIEATKKESFSDRHKPFVTGVYQVTFYIMSIYAFFKWLVQLFQTANEGNVIGFLVTFVLATIYQGFTAIIGTAVWGTVALIVLFLPYLLLRGLTK